MTHFFAQFGQSMAFVAVAGMYMFIAKSINERMRMYTLGEEDAPISNLAFGFRQCGLYLGLAIGMIGAINGESHGFARDFAAAMVDGVLVTVFLIIAQKINDWAIVHGLDNDQAIRDGNIAVGLTEFGSYIATGLVAYGSFVGEGGGLMSAVSFFILGQLALLTIVWLYEIFASSSLLAAVRNGDLTAGLTLTGMIIAFGFILKASIQGDFVSWAQDLSSFGMSAVLGMVLLLTFNAIVNMAHSSKTILRSHDAASAAVVGAVKIGLAIVIGSVAL